MAHEKLHAAVIGIGSRGYSMLKVIHSIKDLDIVAVCDIDEDRMLKGVARLKELGVETQGYTDYRSIIDRGDIDLVYVITNWITHWEICIAFMEAGIYTATEVCGAASLDECWALVRTYERTGTPLMFLENDCYNRKKLALLNMYRQGVLGKLIYAECGYCHDLRWHICDTTHQRCNNNLLRNGDLYPTHGAGPMMKMLDINHGNRFLTISSMSTEAYGVQDYLQRANTAHPLADPRNVRYRCGDVTTSLIKCAGGEVLMLRHNVALPRPHDQAFLVQGTRGVFCEENDSIHIDVVHPEGHWEPITNLLDAYEHPLWKDFHVDEDEDSTWRRSPILNSPQIVDPNATSAGHSHIDIDFLVYDAFAEAARNHTEPPIDVYDAATLMAITVLSEQSVAMGGIPQAFPDFTRGKWASGRKANGGKYCLDQENVFKKE